MVPFFIAVLMATDFDAKLDAGVAVTMIAGIMQPIHMVPIVMVVEILSMRRCAQEEKRQYAGG